MAPRGQQLCVEALSMRALFADVHTTKVATEIGLGLRSLIQIGSH